jgi:hypothetical protein
MTVLLAIDESSGLQQNDTSTAPPTRFLTALGAAGASTTAGTYWDAVSGGSSSNLTGSPFITTSTTPALPSNLTDVAFTDGSGNPLAGTATSLLTLNGSHVYLYSSGTDDNVVFGRVGQFDGTTWSANATGAIAFAAFLDTGVAPASGDGDLGATAVKLWVVDYGALKHPVTTDPNDFVALSGLLNMSVSKPVEFSAEGAPSGQNLFLMLGDGSPSTTDPTVVVTGRDPANQSGGASITTGDTVNTGQGGGSTTLGTNNQMVDPGEGMYFTFVKGADTNYTVPNLDQNEADVEQDISFTSLFGSTGASFGVVQLQPQKSTSVQITASVAGDTANTPTNLADDTVYSGVDYVDHLHDNYTIDITSITVTRPVKGSTTPLTYTFNEGSPPPSSTGGITVNFSPTAPNTTDLNAAVVSGLLQGDRIAYTTATPHDRVLVENAGGSAFDIGGFRLETGATQTAALGDIDFYDAGPSITLGTPTDTTVLNTQDAQTIGVLTDTDTKGFLTSFSVASSSYGADGAGTTVGGFALSLGSTAPDSGLKSESNTIYLYLVSGTVIGSTSTTQAGITAANTVFDVSVGASSGDVTLNQYQEIDHALPGDTSNYSLQQAVLANDKIILTGTATITDGDGDSAAASKTIDLGGNIKFDDDGPTASIVRTVNTITLDETVGAKTGDANAATDDITLVNQDPFAAAYGTPIGALSGVDLVDTTVTTGADSVGATTDVSLAITGGSGASSGLTTSDGTAINLYLETNGTVTGRTVSGSGTVIFAVKIDGSGNVAVAQYAGLHHSVTTNPDDAVDLSGKLSAVVVEEDHDGDTATSSVGIGSAILFQDDGPALAVGNLVGTGTTLAQIGYWAGSAGTDGLGATGVDITLDAFTLIPLVGSSTAGTITSFSEGSPSPDLSGNYHWAGVLAGDFNNNGLADDDPVSFTLTAYADNHYALQLATPVASTFSFDTADGALAAGGPDPVQTLYIPKPPATPEATVVFFSALPNASYADLLADVGLGGTDPDEASLQGPPLDGGIDPRAMNVSTSGIGVGNNVLQGDSSAAIGGTDEAFVANPDILCTSVTFTVDNSVGGYSHSGGEDMYYRVFYDDGSTSGGVNHDPTLITTDLGLGNKGQDTTFTINTVSGKLIDAVELIMAKGDVKIPNIVFEQKIESLADGLKLDFTATITDKDGDSASDGFTALLNTSQAVGSTYDFILAGTGSVQDAFNVDLSSAKTNWEVTGFDTGTLRDKLVFLGDALATASVDNSGTNSIVTVTETLGGTPQTTTVTVVGVNLLATDFTGLASVTVI